LLTPLHGSLGPLGQKYGGADPNADLKALTDAWWSFNGTPNDSGPNALHLTPVNSPTYGTGHVYAQAANLVAASSQYFKRPDGTDAALADGNTDKTFTAWFNLTDTDNYQCIIGKYTAASEYVIYLNTSGASVQTYVEYQNGLHTGPAVTTTLGAWHLYVVTYTASDTRLRVYLDNVQIGAAVVVGTFTQVNKDFSIGRPGAFNGQYANGLIEAVGEFHASFDTTQRGRLWNGGAGLALY